MCIAARYLKEANGRVDRQRQTETWGHETRLGIHYLYYKFKATLNGRYYIFVHILYS